MSVRSLCQKRLVTVVAVASVSFANASAAQEQFLARGGTAEAVIVVGPEGNTFDRWVAGEGRPARQRRRSSRATPTISMSV
jgi:hypothetical protein